jgi:pimeloyl-ACP methyl ester carboxylesterase
MSYLGLSGNKPESQFPRSRKRNVIERVKSAAGVLFVMGALAAFLSAAPVFAQQATPPDDVSRHTVHFVGVDNNVTLEVLDWGGSGKPLVLVAGLGGTAHDFDQFAPQLSGTCHVYGITRRGFGASSAPVPAGGNYSADRLGDDVLAVLDSLSLDRPVLAGHSIGGEELSSVGTRHPERIAGLIYLDAAYSYAYYDRSQGDAWIDSIELRKKLEQLIPGNGPDPRQVVQDLRQALPRFEKTLRDWQRDLEALPPLPTSILAAVTPAQAILEGQQKYTNIRVPVLAIYASPPDPKAPYNEKKLRAWRLKRAAARAKAFKAGVPSARVVRLRHASHFVYRSNEFDVLREMRAFLASLN